MSSISDFNDFITTIYQCTYIKLPYCARVNANQYCQRTPNISSINAACIW